MVIGKSFTKGSTGSTKGSTFEGRLSQRVVVVIEFHSHIIMRSSSSSHVSNIGSSLEINRHFIKKKFDTKFIVTTHVPIWLQVTYVFTKGLPTTRF
ncbi:hypothetical protein CR513_03555, partial [Mucuna pruriens]